MSSLRIVRHAEPGLLINRGTRQEDGNRFGVETSLRYERLCHRPTRRKLLSSDMTMTKWRVRALHKNLKPKQVTRSSRQVRCLTLNLVSFERNVEIGLHSTRSNQQTLWSACHPSYTLLVSNVTHTHKLCLCVKNSFFTVMLISSWCNLWGAHMQNSFTISVA